MQKRTPTPLGSLIRGAVAGVAGLAAMDVLLYRLYKRDGGEDDFLAWEFSAGTESYEQAAAPAQVGKRLVEGYLQTDLEPGTARSMNNAVHWGTGIAWGVVHGVLAGSAGNPKARYGLATGALAWAGSYAMLAPAGLYEPIWKYPVSVLANDLRAHLVFGAVTGTVFRALSRS